MAEETRVRRRSDGELTRQRVLDAAVASILEQGYYQTSSNEIARRAGVTWGTIQHQFGTREALLLEVLNDRWARLQQQMATAVIHGGSLEDRLAEVLNVLAQHYEQPVHLVQLQILLDLGQNPSTSKETRRAITAHGERLHEAWQPLFDQALGPAAQEADLVRFAFAALRGYLSGTLMAKRLGGSAADDTAGRRLLVHGVAVAIADEAKARGLTIA